MSFDPTGAQIHLTLERDGHVVTADVTQVGASLRGLTVDGVDLIARYPEGTPAPGASGVVLVPWPNRVRGGTWTQNGVERQLAITEVPKNNAIHGLLRYTSYVVSAFDSAVTLRANVVPQTGYPYLLETAVTYALTPDGVVVTHQIRNSGTEAAPVAIGTHPYLTVGDADPASLTITSSGATEILIDEQSIPVGSVPVTAEHDLRGGRNLGQLRLDTAYTDLARGESGMATHHLADAAGNQTILWQDASFPYVQFYTATTYPGHEVALACEPMTAPADAFNSGDGLRWIQPDESFSASWGIAFRPAR